MWSCWWVSSPDTHTQPTITERLPLVQSPHERLLVVWWTLSCPYVSVGRRTGLRMDHTHKHTHIQRHWWSAAVLSLTVLTLVGQVFLTKAVELQYLRRLSGESGPPWLLYLPSLNNPLLCFTSLQYQCHRTPQTIYRTWHCWIHSNAHDGFHNLGSDKKSQSQNKMISYWSHSKAFSLGIK